MPCPEALLGIHGIGQEDVYEACDDVDLVVIQILGELKIQTHKME